MGVPKIGFNPLEIGGNIYLEDSLDFPNIYGESFESILVLGRGAISGLLVLRAKTIDSFGLIKLVYLSIEVFELKFVVLDRELFFVVNLSLDFK